MTQLELPTQEEIKALNHWLIHSSPHARMAIMVPYPNLDGCHDVIYVTSIYHYEISSLEMVKENELTFCLKDKKFKWEHPWGGEQDSTCIPIDEDEFEDADRYL